MSRARLAGCGSDPLKDGHLDIDSGGGDLSLTVSGAAANASYTIILRGLDGLDSPPLGTLATNSKGSGTLNASAALAASSVSAAVLVLRRNGVDQALAGFNVTSKLPPKPALRPRGLVRCLDVNDPDALGNCGTDPLISGSATVNPKGKLSVILNGAGVSTSYEAFFQPINSDSSGDVGTPGSR